MLLGLDIRGRFPIKEPTRLVIAATVFDVDPASPKDDPQLEPVYSQDPRFREEGSYAFRIEHDFGVVDPGRGFRHWAAALGLIVDAFLPPDEGSRQFRVLVVAYDAEHPPQFDHGSVIGDVLWAAAHDYSAFFEGSGYRTIERNRVFLETAMMELAILGTDPKGEHPETRRGLEAWIEERTDGAWLDEGFDRRAALTNALDTAMARAAKGNLEPERRVRKLLEADGQDPGQPLEMALDLLALRGGTDGRIAGLFELGELLQVSRADVQAMIDKRAGGLTREPSTGGELRDLLGIDPAWDRPRVLAHLSNLYRQWNSRAESLEDPEKRAEAEAMLERIAQVRTELETSGTSA